MIILVLEFAFFFYLGVAMAKASFLSHEVHRFYPIAKKKKKGIVFSLLRHTRHCHIAGYHITNNVGSRVTFGGHVRWSHVIFFVVSQEWRRVCFPLP
jgi:hypothetical protein